ncbi:hypothetical protein [Sphingopyxis sp. P8]|uniref:hypothetical protein n=1 Tax=Sphingopyxis sp. P8 TaxID=2763256 RepID=UPI001D0A380D|nr:hypothetical protein [Sphingopyxis sp. P8]
MARDEDLEPVMLALGNAVFAAQCFEMNLGTTLIALTVAKGDRTKFPDEDAVYAWLARVDRLTVGQLAGELRALNVLPEPMINDIGEINRRRIEVVHHFANRWVDELDAVEGRVRAIDDLRSDEVLFLEAARKLQEGTHALSEMRLIG